MRQILVIAWVVATLGTLQSAFGAAGAWAGPDAPPELVKFRNTYYYSVPEANPKYAGLPADTDLLDMNDQVLARVSSKFRHDVDIEGTGHLADGRIINFAGRKDGSIRYHVTAHPFGHGVGDCALRPFHTIAVDPGRIPLGSTVQIDETVGMLLPDGTRHDGIWHADDVGSAIQHDRVDLFVGEGDQGKVLERAGIDNLMPLTIRLVAPAPEHPCTEIQPSLQDLF